MNNKLKVVKKQLDSNDETCEGLVDVFSLLSNKSRLKILCMLREGEFCVNDIVAAVSPGKLTNISQQLRILTLSGITQKRRMEQKIIYSIADDRIRELLNFLEGVYGCKKGKK